jgi:chain length determinant protein EpsF
MDFSQYMLALRARRKTFTTIFAATVLTAIVVAFIVPKRYDASATVMLDSRAEQTLTAGSMTPRERAGFLGTQIDLITSGKVAQKVVRDLKLAQQPGAREDFESETGGVGTIEEWLAAQLLEKVKVDSSASNVLTIKYSSDNAKKAADVANGFAKAYLDVSLALRTEPTREAAEWFDEQVKTLRTQVNQSQAKLSSYQREKGIVGADERMDIEYTKLTEISAQLNTAKNATYDANTRAKQVQEAIAKGATADNFPEIQSNAYITTVKADLQRAEARFNEQASVLGENHPAQQRTKMEVANLRERLAAETKKVIAGLANTAQQSRQREQELTNALAAQNERILKLKDARVELAVMTRDVENAQRAYDTALGRFMTMKVESRAKATNLALLTPAVQPAKPAQPKIPLVAALALLVGGLLAAGVVYLLEMLDRRVRSKGELEARLAVPSLGGISRWHAVGGRLLPALSSSNSGGSTKALPHPW